MRCQRPRGRCTTGSWNRLRVGMPPMFCSEWSGTGKPPPLRANVKTSCGKSSHGCGGGHPNARRSQGFELTRRTRGSRTSPRCATAWNCHGSPRPGSGRMSSTSSRHPLPFTVEGGCKTLSGGLRRGSGRRFSGRTGGGIGGGGRGVIVGRNGAGKSTLLGLLAGTVTPTGGRVKRGKTVQLGILDQTFTDLADIASDRVREVLARTKTTFTVEGKDLTPAQLLERLGFAREHLSTRVGELSGGQQRRLQFLLVLLAEPNVLILDEPTNDVDTDMLAAIEDLLDSWPGTLIVVSHDRYLVERVTDQQYAIIDGRLRHLPGGVDEYLRIRANDHSLIGSGSGVSGVTTETGSDADGASHSRSSALTPLSSADERVGEKEGAAVESKVGGMAEQVSAIHDQMAAHDQSDYQELTRMMESLARLSTETAGLEERWFELSDRLNESLL